MHEQRNYFIFNVPSSTNLLSRARIYAEYDFTQQWTTGHGCKIRWEERNHGLIQRLTYSLQLNRRAPKNPIVLWSLYLHGSQWRYFIMHEFFYLRWVSMRCSVLVEAGDFSQIFYRRSICSFWAHFATSLQKDDNEDNELGNCKKIVSIYSLAQVKSAFWCKATYKRP